MNSTKSFIQSSFNNLFIFINWYAEMLLCEIIFWTQAVLNIFEMFSILKIITIKKIYQLKNVSIKINFTAIKYAFFIFLSSPIVQSVVHGYPTQRVSVKPFPQKIFSNLHTLFEYSPSKNVPFEKRGKFLMIWGKGMGENERREKQIPCRNWNRTRKGISFSKSDT